MATFARRLLKGVGFGMHYQWGRKDPFTPATNTGYVNQWNAKEVQIYKADGIAITKGDRGIATTEKLSEFKYEARTITNQTTINDLIQNPSTHYDKGDGTNLVPIASTTHLTKDWWNPTIKTIYDPCPNGYRIPENGTYGTGSSAIHPDWSVWSVGGLNSGRIFKNTSFFPASGLRYSSISGQFDYVGSWGYSWMSTPISPTHGHYLYLISGLIDPNRSAGRSFGLPTRCIKE